MIFQAKVGKGGITLFVLHLIPNKNLAASKAIRTHLNLLNALIDAIEKEHNKIMLSKR